MDARRPAAQSGPRNPLLAKLTSLTSIATVAAAGIIVVGILAVVGGNYDKQVVRDQLVPQKIFFPAANNPALLPGIKQYAGQKVAHRRPGQGLRQQLITCTCRRSPVARPTRRSALPRIAAPKNASSPKRRRTLFQGETLRGLLLNAWGWSLVGDHRHTGRLDPDPAGRDPIRASARQLADQPQRPPPSDRRSMT